MSSGSEYISNVSNWHEAPAIITGNEVSFPKPANPGAYGVIYVNNLTGEAFIYTRTGWIPFAGGGGGGVTSADNGLYIFDANTVRLGTNPLLEDTTIDLAGFLLSIGNDGQAALVLQPGTGISRLGAFGATTNNTFITVDDAIQLIKLNVDSAGGAFTKGIALDGVNDSYKFGNTQSVALEIIGGITNTLKTFMQGSNFGLNIDYANAYITLGDIDNLLNVTRVNLDINNASIYLLGNLINSILIDGSNNEIDIVTSLVTISGKLGIGVTGITTVALEVEGETKFNSATGNYQFLNVPTYTDNTAALAGGLSVGMIYQLGGTLGAASVLAIVY